MFNVCAMRFQLQYKTCYSTTRKDRKVAKFNPTSYVAEATFIRMQHKNINLGRNLSWNQ